MRFKLNTTVIFTRTNLTIIKAVEGACLSILGPTYEPECTSGQEGDHSEESGHYHGRALDFKINDIYHTNHDPIKKKVQSLLGPDYFVLLEPTHLHVQRNKDSM